MSQAIHVVARLGVADHLQDGPRSVSDLAQAVGAHEQSLYRLLRALAAVGVFKELPDRNFELTEMGSALRSDAARSLAGWAAFVGRPYYWRAWSRMFEAVVRGEHAFRLEHGTDVWTYRREHEDEIESFNRAMNSASSVVVGAVAAAHDFRSAATVVDVGGGGGLLVTTVLAANPHLRGVLFDQLQTVDSARTFVQQSAVADRCDLVGGDFFESVPDGADVYLLKSILHDWYDPEARRILATIRRAARADSVLLVIEPVLQGPNEGAPAKFSDLNMMVAAGGQERTRDEWEALLASGGWRLAELRGPFGTPSVIVARPA